jgi:putative SOS response-associated peptidase YedK
MCTRYLLLERDYRAMMERLGIPAPAQFVSRYNIAPSSALPVVRTAPGAPTREAVTLRWGLVPSWAKSDDGAKLVNARAETVAEKPSFRDALRKRRCVIPASGFYEWETRGREKLPWLFRRRDEQPFGFAGLWESWRAPKGGTIETCAFVTTAANDLMRPIHDRIPVLLRSDQFESWLDPQVTDAVRLGPLLQSPPADELSAIRVSRYMSNVRHEGPACLAPPAADDANGDTPQLSLGI